MAGGTAAKKLKLMALDCLVLSVILAVMRVPTLIIAFALALSLLSSDAAWSADFDKGVSAWLKGDYATALQEWEPLAEQGDAEAQYWLGFLYHFGSGVTQNFEETAKWYRRSAEQGLAKAQFSLGHLYAIGHGVPQNHEEAAKWYRRAAEQGHESAQYSLGHSYESGFGVTQNLEEAVKWYKRAAKQGYAHAQLKVGVLYHEGKGVPHQSNAQAEKWFRLAAEQVNATAQFNLGRLYHYGEGVPQNYIYAHMWYNLAASNGHESSGESRDEVAKLLTDEQIVEAQKLAAECRKNRYKGC